MFSELIHRANVQLSKKLPFVIYRKPNQKEVKVILQKTNQLHLVTDLKESSGFVFSPFDSSRKSVLIPLDEVLVATDFEPSNVTSVNAIDVDTSAKGEHLILVEKAIEEIRKETFQKVVVSRKLVVTTAEEATTLFKRLITSYKSAFCYLWYHPKIGTWLGATPEILLRTENRQFTTMSLAGTHPFVANENFTWGKKEIQEQLVVTDYIKTVLKNDVIDLKTSELETIKAGNLVHLRTKLMGRISSGLDDIIKKLHPTPAVCGMPMAVSKAFILGNENYDREFYTGFLGELNFREEQQRTSNGKNQENQAYRSIKIKSELFVNLRCMKLENETASVYVGGGITMASNPENEWQETVNKTETILRILL